MRKPDPLRFAELREINVRRCVMVFHPLEDWSPTDWACALAGEIGEACNEIKKLRRLDGADAESDTPAAREAIKARIAKELADSAIYLDLLAAALSIDLGAAVRQKFNEVSDRRGTDIKLPESELGVPFIELIRAAVNEHCSCGGSGIGDMQACVACKVWHEIVRRQDEVA